MQKRTCDIIVSYLQNYNNMIKLNFSNISPNEIFELMSVIDKDYPEHTGICEGYAKLLKYFCDAVGIRCFIISGKGTDDIRNVTENHAWNIVSLDGFHFHHVDVTWDSIRKQNNVHNDYYLRGDAFMMKDHYWSDNGLPSCIEYR